MPSPSPQRAPEAPSQPLPQGAEDCRCRCGSLVARIVAEGVEIKCRRCKRDLLVPWSAREGWTPAIVRPEPPSAERDEPVLPLRRDAR